MEVTQEQRDQVRDAVAKLVEADELDQFESEDLEELWRKRFRTVAAFEKASRETLLSVLAPGLVGFLKPDAGGLVTPFVPTQFVSYSSLINSHINVGRVHQLQDLLAAGMCDPWRQRFEQRWPKVQEDLQQHASSPKVTFKVSEQHNYAPFSEVLQQLWCAFFGATNRRRLVNRIWAPTPKGVSVFIDTSGGADKTRPDIALCMIPEGYTIEPKLLYERLILCAEGKSASAELSNAFGQIIDRASRMCKAQKLDKALLPAFAFVGGDVWPALISVSHGHSVSPCIEVYRTLGPLVLASTLDVDVDVDYRSIAGKYLGLLVFMAGRHRLEAAAAAVDSGAYLHPGDDLLVTSGDQAVERLLRVEDIFPGRHLTGSVCAATMGGNVEERLAVRVGPAPDVVAVARGLFADLGPWQQADREYAALSTLPSTCPYLPHLLFKGRLTAVMRCGLRGACADACAELRGASVLVTELHGTPLVVPGCAALPRLQPAALCRVAACLVAACGVLQAHRVWHNDIQPRNIGMRADGSFYLFDLGAAASPGLDALELAPDGPRVSLVDRSPIRSFTFSSLEAIRGDCLGPLADMQMCVHTLVMLAGGMLPWHDDVIQSPNWEAASAARISMQTDKDARRRVLSCLPQPVRQLAEWVYANCSQLTPPEQQAALWHDRLLRAAKAHDSRASAEVASPVPALTADVTASGSAPPAQQLPGGGVLAF